MHLLPRWETGDSRLTAVGNASLGVVQADVIADAIVETILFALVGVAALLMLVYRWYSTARHSAWRRLSPSPL